MDDRGINWPLVAAQSLNLVLLLAWVALAFIALRQLRHRQLDELPRALWAALIILIPVIGACAFLIVRPGAQR